MRPSMMSVLMALMVGCKAHLSVTPEPSGAMTYNATGPGSTGLVRNAYALDAAEGLAQSTGNVNMAITSDRVDVSAGGPLLTGYAPSGGLYAAPDVVLGPGGQPLSVQAAGALPNIRPGILPVSNTNNALFAPCPPNREPVNQAEVNGCAEQDRVSLAGR